MSSRSTSTQQNLNANLRKKDEEIAQLKDIIQQVDAVLLRHVNLLEQVSNELYDSLKYLNPEKFELSTGKQQVSLNIQNDLLFKPRSVTRLVEKTAFPILEKVAEVLVKYPNMSISIIGHTDNRPPRRRADVDNWNVSAQRAAVIVRLLIDDFDLSSSQLLLAAKGEYAPRASNETDEGKNKNQRIEFLIAPRAEELEKAVRKVIEN